MSYLMLMKKNSFQFSFGFNGNPDVSTSGFFYLLDNKKPQKQK